MRILFLDDMQERHAAFARNRIGLPIEHVWTAKQAIESLQTSPPFDYVYLDHDLAEEHYLHASGGLREEALPGEEVYDPGTGMDVVDFIIKMSKDQQPIRVVVHSMNPVRGPEMEQRLIDAGVWVRRHPFSRLI